MVLSLIDEYSDKGHLIYIDNLPGGYVRGFTRQDALDKLPGEAESYMLWAGLEPYCAASAPVIIQEKHSTLAIEDADSDVIFESEKLPLTIGEYMRLRHLALKSARDFLELYRSMPDADACIKPCRRTFYGDVPATPRQMYEHTKSVNSYYFGEIDVAASNEQDILACRKAGFDRLEQSESFLENTLFGGSYGEDWTLRKVCRRFIWHDRIHAKAMYRGAADKWGADAISDPFFFRGLLSEKTE